MFRASRFTKKGASIRFFNRDVAIVHGTWELTGALGRDGHVRPPELGIATYVMGKTNGNWQIVAFQNTLVVPSPDETVQ